MDRWVGRVAIVTGASSGIGECLAKALVGHGMKVAALARREDRLQKLESECKQYKGTLKGYKCDISKENDIKMAVDAIFKDLGPISVLVNNAAAMKPLALSDTSDIDSCRKMFETNVIGLVTITQQVLEIMKKHNIHDGHVINVNSVLGHCVPPLAGLGCYGSSKCAALILTECLKNELANLNLKTRVTSISPGLVRTEMSQAYFKNSPEIEAKLNHLRSEDIVDCIIFVLSINSNVNISEMTIQPVGETLVKLEATGQ